MTRRPWTIKRAGIRLVWCILGYGAGCLASGLSSSIYLSIPSGTNGIGQIFLMTAYFTAIYALPAAPVLILLGEIMGWRSLKAYVGLAVIAALVSSQIWLQPGFDGLEMFGLILTAGIASGVAFWAMAIRDWRQSGSAQQDLETSV